MLRETLNNLDIMTVAKYREVIEALNAQRNLNLAYVKGIAASASPYDEIARSTEYTSLSEALPHLCPQLELDVREENAVLRLFGYMLVTTRSTSATGRLRIDFKVDGSTLASDYTGFDLIAEESDGICEVYSWNAGRPIVAAWDVLVLGVPQGKHTFDPVLKTNVDDANTIRFLEGQALFYAVQEYGVLTE